MRRIKRLTGLLAVGVGVAASATPAHAQQQAQPRPRPQPEAARIAAERPNAAAQMDALLQKWAAQSARTKTLDAKYTRVDHSPQWHVETKYDGRAILQAPNLACLNLSKTAKAPGAPAEFYERIICTGDKVYHYQGPTKQIYIYPIELKDQQKALQQGPLPFMFNMNVEEAKRRYHMTLLAEKPTHYEVRIIPLLENDRGAFTQAFVYLNRERLLPDKLVLIEPNGKDTQTYTFSEVVRNDPRGVNADNFKFVAPKGWSIVNNAAPESAPARNAAAAAPGVDRNARPAMNPAPARRR